MDITEVRIKLMEDGGDRLKAFCSITFDDCFVVRDLKIIEGSSGPFVAMPSRKLTSHCGKCGYKNHLRANYCNQCGEEQDAGRADRDDDGRAKLYADIAHPINSECREMIQSRVIEEYEAEQDLSTKPGYISRYDDYDYDGPTPHITPTKAKAEDDFDEDAEDSPTKPQSETAKPQSEAAKPHIEQAESGPRAPHQRPQDAGADKHSSEKPRKQNGGFGAGIF